MIAIALLAPVNCYEDPIDKQRWKGRPESTCGEGPHTVLMVLSMLALVMYPVACFGVTMMHQDEQQPLRAGCLGLCLQCVHSQIDGSIL